MRPASGIVLIAALMLGAVIVADIILRQKKKDPTLIQWTNRLIEHIEPEYIVEAAKRFHGLVEGGLTPAHAFEIAIRT